MSVHNRGFSFKEEMGTPVRWMNSFVLPGLAEKCVWEKFALLLTRCWSSLDNRPGREAVAKLSMTGFRNQVPAGGHVVFAGAPESSTRLGTSSGLECGALAKGVPDCHRGPMWCFVEPILCRPPARTALWPEGQNGLSCLSCAPVAVQ